MKNDVYIHKDVLGFSQHLLCQPESGKILKTPSIPQDHPLVYGTPMLQEVSKVYNLPLPEFPPRSHVKALQGALNQPDVSEVPWGLAIPPGAFRRAVEGLGAELLREFGNLDLSYFTDHYQVNGVVIKEMERARIDPRAWMVHSGNKDLVTPHVFRSFEPCLDGFAEKVVYSKCETRTGRLKVMEGPNILLLPREQRNILGSRFGHQGRVMSLDFSSLEPRTALYLKVLTPYPLQSPPPGYPPRHPLPYDSATSAVDLYRTMMQALEITDLSRDLVKEVVLSEIYGAGYERIMGILAGQRDATGLIQAIEEFFGLNEIRERLLGEWESTGRQSILSHYGRRVDAAEAQPYMLLNYYLQSTAVDIALYGFLKILRLIQGNPQIIPLFILHDALILDVHLEALSLLPSLTDAGSREIPLFPGCVFPIKASRFG